MSRSISSFLVLLTSLRYDSLHVGVCVYVFKNVFLFYVFFLKHGNCYSYQILYAISNSCKLSFHVVTKKLIDGKPSFVRKNTALRKFNVSIHLMTSVDRAGIVSKKICGNFDFMPLLKSYDNFKKFVSYLINKNTSFERKI